MEERAAQIVSRVVCDGLTHPEERHFRRGEERGDGVLELISAGLRGVEDGCGINLGRDKDVTCGCGERLDVEFEGEIGEREGRRNSRESERDNRRMIK